MVVALLAAIALGAAHGSVVQCSAAEIRASVGGRTACLAWDAPCSLRYGTQYSRYGFRCVHGRLRYIWPSIANLRRPLRIPTLPPDAQCPATRSNGTLRQRGNTDSSGAAFGPGPAYVTLESDNGSAALTMAWPVAAANQPYEGWAGTKALWTIPRFGGPVLIRGRQLDGTGPLGFDLGPNWTNTVLSELRLDGPRTSLNPAATFVKSAGCYAYQVDTARSSYIIVFQARFR